MAFTGNYIHYLYAFMELEQMKIRPQQSTLPGEVRMGTLITKDGCRKEKVQAHVPRSLHSYIGALNSIYDCIQASHGDNGCLKSGLNMWTSFKYPLASEVRGQIPKPGERRSSLRATLATQWR